MPVNSFHQLKSTMLFVLIVVSLSFGRHAGSQDWSQWAGPDRDFTVSGVTFDSGTDFASIKEAWRIPVGPGDSGICVRGDFAYTCFTRDGKQQVIAVSTIDGRKVWQRTLEVSSLEFLDLEFGPGPHSTPLVTEKRLFCLGLTGRLSALDVQTGKTVWERQLWADGVYTKLERGCAASPIAYGDTIIVPVGGAGKSVRCFAMADGSIRWQKHDFDCAYASPVVAELCGRFQAVLLMDQTIIGLDPETGELLWSHPVPTENYVNCTSPIVGPRDTIFINTGDGLRGLKTMVADQKFEVQETWASRVTICQTTNFVLQRGTIFGAKEGGIFAALDADSGRTLWQQRVLRDCCVVAVGECLIAVQETGELVIAEVTRQGIEEKWRRSKLTGRCWVGPVVANGLLLVRDLKHLIAFRLPG